jgi:hypothetical protein
LFDGILKKALGPAPVLTAGQLTQQKIAQVRFLPMLCPNCGTDMHGSKESIVLVCSQCTTAWRATTIRFEKTGFSIWPVLQQADLWLTFWRFDIRCDTIPMETSADVFQFTKMQAIPGAVTGKQKFYFYIPAFKTNPEVLLRLGRIVSLKQPPLEQMQLQALTRFYPVNLGQQEAFEAVPVLLDDMSMAKKAAFTKIRDAKFELQSAASLLFIPFVKKGYEFVQPQLNLSVLENALKWGQNF